MNVAVFLDEQIKIVEDDTRRNFLRATILLAGGVIVIAAAWLLFGRAPTGATAPLEVTKQIMGLGGGLFTAALSVAPFKQITPNRRRAAALRAARGLPPEQIAPLVVEAVREALKGQG